jgi:ABC-2 type transport system ATP-binding protein
MTYTVISVEGLTARYGDRVVLDRLTLDIGPGVLALLGPNGAGKTTLVDTVTTLRRPDSGRVRVLGHDVVEEAPAVRALLGVTGQQASVDVVLTGRENLVLTGRLLGLGRVGSRRRADELLARFDLVEPADRRVGTWSGGMRRRLDLAASLVTTPRVLVLDEPTTGLDARSRRALWEEVRAVAAAGTTVLLTTQYLEEADVLADRVVVLDGGRVVADGTPDALRRTVGGEVVQVHDAAGAVTDVVSTDGSAADVARVVAGLPPTARVTVRRPSMDEVFLHLTGDGSRKSTGSAAPAASAASDDRPVDAEVSA